MTQTASAVGRRCIAGQVQIDPASFSGMLDNVLSLGKRVVRLARVDLWVKQGLADADRERQQVDLPTSPHRAFTPADCPRSSFNEICFNEPVVCDDSLYNLQVLL